MNIKDIFEKAEGGTLTYAQFESAVKAGNGKFVDLSEGNYVSKQKYDSELASKDSTIDQLNGTISQRDTDLANLKTQLSNAGTDANKLSALQTDFDNLQNKYATDVKEYQAKLDRQQYEFAVREFAGTKKFTSNAAKRDFTTAMIGANLTMKGEKIIGADDFVTSYSEENADAFVTDDKQPEPTPQPTPAPAKPTFVQPTGGGTPTPTDHKLFGFDFTTIRKKE